MKTSELKRLIIIVGAMTQVKPDLTSAVELAIELNAQLEALYIEDDNLFRLVELPVAAEVARSTGKSRSFNLARLERLLRSQAFQIEQELIQITTEKEISCKFQVIRGQIAKEIVGSGLEEDIIFLSESRQFLKQTFLLEKIIQEMLARKQHTTLFFHQHCLLSRGFEHRIVIFYDGSALSDRMLVLAQSIFPIRKNELFVIIPSDDEKKLTHLKRKLSETLKEHPHVKTHSLPLKEIVETLIEMDNQQQLTSIILPIDSAKAKNWDLTNLLSHLKCNVLLMK